MTQAQENLCNLLGEAIDIANSLLAKGESREKVKEYINKIEDPILRRIVLISTGLWN